MPAEADGRSALLGQSHDVALRVGDQREGHPGHVLRFLDNLAAEFSGPFHGASISSTAMKKVTRSEPPCNGLIAVYNAPGTPVSTKV